MTVLMLDVDGVLVSGRPGDGAHPFTDLERDLGLPASLLQAAFFDPYWQNIVTGRDQLEPRLAAVLGKVWPSVSARQVIDYWFARDSRVMPGMLDAVGRLRSEGVRVLLATNQEHLRARYLMETLGLGAHVDGIVYSAALGHRKPSAEFFRMAAARS